MSGRSGEDARLLAEALPWLDWAYFTRQKRPGTSDDLRILLGKVRRQVSDSGSNGEQS